LYSSYFKGIEDIAYYKCIAWRAVDRTGVAEYLTTYVPPHLRSNTCIFGLQARFLLNLLVLLKIRNNSTYSCVPVIPGQSKNSFAPLLPVMYDWRIISILPLRRTKIWRGSLILLYHVCSFHLVFWWIVDCSGIFYDSLEDSYEGLWDNKPPAPASHGCNFVIKVFLYQTNQAFLDK
jgi:hypothetical protein